MEMKHEIHPATTVRFLPVGYLKRYDLGRYCLCYFYATRMPHAQWIINNRVVPLADLIGLSFFFFSLSLSLSLGKVTSMTLP